LPATIKKFTFYKVNFKIIRKKKRKFERKKEAKKQRNKVKWQRMKQRIFCQGEKNKQEDKIHLNK
jgi:hypothetical protein